MNEECKWTDAAASTQVDLSVPGGSGSENVLPETTMQRM